MPEIEINPGLQIQPPRQWNFSPSGTGVPPTSQPYYGLAQYPGNAFSGAAGSYSPGVSYPQPGVQINPVENNYNPSITAIPGAGYNPNQGWTGRMFRAGAAGAAGGPAGIAIGLGIGGLGEAYRRIFNRGTAPDWRENAQSSYDPSLNPDWRTNAQSSYDPNYDPNAWRDNAQSPYDPNAWRANAQGSNVASRPPGFQASPINLANWQTFNTRAPHAGQGYGQGTTAWERSGTGVYSQRDALREQSADSARVANLANFTGSPNRYFTPDVRGRIGDDIYDLPAAQGRGRSTDQGATSSGNLADPAAIALMMRRQGSYNAFNPAAPAAASSFAPSFNASFSAAPPPPQPVVPSPAPVTAQATRGSLAPVRRGFAGLRGGGGGRGNVV